MTRPPLSRRFGYERRVGAAIDGALIAYSPSRQRRRRRPLFVKEPAAVRIDPFLGPLLDLFRHPDVGVDDRLLPRGGSRPEMLVVPVLARLRRRESSPGRSDTRRSCRLGRPRRHRSPRSRPPPHRPPFRRRRARRPRPPCRCRCSDRRRRRRRDRPTRTAARSRTRRRSPAEPVPSGTAPRSRSTRHCGGPERRGVRVFMLPSSEAIPAPGFGPT